jgi:Serine protease inhibitor
VLTNALYLYAPWQRPFYPEATEEGDFSRPDGTGVKASFMNQTDEMAYGAGDGWQAVELPYRGNEFALLAIVPDDGRFAEIEEGFDSRKLQQVVDSLASRLVALALPKFEMSSDISLRGALEALGMTQAFQLGVADLSAMDGVPHNLFVSGIFHQGFIAVDEEGTKAAAATAVVVAGAATTEIQLPFELRIDRPFLWVIRDVPTGTVLFVGQVADPSV